MLTTMIDPAAARARIEEAVALKPGPARLVNLAVRDVHVRDGWVVQYECHIEDPAGDVRRRILTAQQTPAERSKRDAKRLLDRRLPGMLDEDILGSFVRTDAEGGFVVYPFPLDLKLRRLPQATSAPVIVDELRACGADVPEIASPLRRFECMPLRYVPSRRCQLLFDLEDGRGHRLRFLGKVFRDDRGEALGHWMNRVAELYAGQPELTAPRAIGYSTTLGVLFQECVPGTTLYERMRAGLTVEADVKASAKSLAVLHASELELDGGHDATDELTVVEKALDRVLLTLEAPAELITALSRLQAFAGALPTCSGVPLHRDFYDKQLIQDGRQTALIDLDQLTIGPPEVDVANFIAHLKLRALQGLITPRSRGALEGRLSDGIRRFGSV